MAYAEKTQVPVDRSKAEIERILQRYGADQFMYGTQMTAAMIAFRAHGKFVRFLLPLPDPADEEYRRRRRGRQPTTPDARLQQEIRRRWRALALSIKGKLEAVESGIMTFEQEFLAHILLPDGTTAGEYMLPQIEEAYRTKRMPKLLPFLERAR